MPIEIIQPSFNVNVLGDKPDWDAFGKPKSTREPSGHVVVNGKVVADTKRCVNCGNHFIMVEGSRRVRGYCTDCGGYLCGIGCIPCKHGMKRMRDYGTRRARLG